MVDLILITFVVVIFIAGFMCGSRFTTASNMWEACIEWLRSKVGRKPQHKDRRVADRRSMATDLRHVISERRVSERRA